MDHIGGNKTEQILQPGIIRDADGRSSFAVGSNSTTGSITIGGALTCGALLLSYDTIFTGMRFSPAYSGVGFNTPVLYSYPQLNGDTIFIGEHNTISSGHDIGIERHDASGRVLWTKIYGGSGSDGLVSVLPAFDGGFFIAAGTNSADNDVPLHHGSAFAADIWILRLDNNGEKHWSTILGGSGTDLPKELHIAPDGGCYVFGVTTSTDHDATGNHGSSDLYIAKLNSNGIKEWHRCLGGSSDDGSGYDAGVAAIADGKGGFYILNRTASGDGDIKKRQPDGFDFWLLHIDGAANILWENTYGGPYHQYPSALCRATDGSLWLGGYFHGGVPAGGQVDICYGKTDSWVVHTDSLGHFINQRVLGGAEGDELKALYPLPDGSVLAVGQYYGSTEIARSPGFPDWTEGDMDLFFARLSPSTVQNDEEELIAEAWQFYPDKPGMKLSIKSQRKVQGKVTLRITDMAGRSVFNSRFKTSTELSLKGWQPGQYLVHLTDRSGCTSRKRLIIDPFFLSPML